MRGIHRSAAVLTAAMCLSGVSAAQAPPAG